MMRYNAVTETDRERYPQAELDRGRESDERRLDDPRREQERARREPRERMERRGRTADDWPEALRKNITLLRYEVSGLPDEADLDAMFENSAQACERALDAFQSDEVKAIEDKIQALRREVLDVVASKLEKDRIAAATGRPGMILCQLLWGPPNNIRVSASYVDEDTARAVISAVHGVTTTGEAAA